MLEALKFVQGAVAKKDFVQALTHFRIENGLVKGYNGMLGLCGPIALDMAVTPRAVQFVKAIQTCKDTIALHLTAAGKLSIKSGPFKAYIDCINEPWPGVDPEGDIVQLNGASILKPLSLLYPFIAEDASRPWARGILLKGQSATATNNVILVEHWMGIPFPIVVNIPKLAVTELLRINEEPTHMQVAENSVTFHFAGNRWLKTQTYSLEWPDLSKVLDADSAPVEIPEGFFDAIDDLLPFVGERGAVMFKTDGSLTTSSAEGEGATIELPYIGAVGMYSLEQLRRLGSVATRADFTRYPKPVLFFGDGIRGAFIGMRV